MPTPAEQASYVQQILASLTDRDIEEAITNLAEYSANPPASPAGSGVPLPDYMPQTSTAKKQETIADSDTGIGD